MYPIYVIWAHSEITKQNKRKQTNKEKKKNTDRYVKFRDKEKQWEKTLVFYLLAPDLHFNSNRGVHC